MNGSVSRHRHVEADALPAMVRPGETVYVSGSSGAPVRFVEELLKTPELTKDVHLLTSYVPGINTLDIDKLHPSAKVSGLFMQGALADAQRAGRYRALPLSYAGFVKFLAGQSAIDVAVVQVSPPDRTGLCSLGPAVEFAPLALSKARRRVALINPNTPALRTSARLPYDSFDAVCEVDTPLPTYTTGTDAPTNAIASTIAGLIDDGAVVQLGLGKVPAALSEALRSHRRLRFHSGMLSDGLLALQGSDALDPHFRHTTCVLVGTQELYHRLPDFAPLRVTGCEVTHDATIIASHERFIAVNSAIEVDLFGQCNLEHIGGAAVSGMGGAPDFARGARNSLGGKSIVALNARYKNGSRIVSALSPPGIASLPRCDVDFVITEFGSAKLAGKSVHERAQALIGVAPPESRTALSSQWDAIAARL